MILFNSRYPSLAKSKRNLVLTGYSPSNKPKCQTISAPSNIQIRHRHAAHIPINLRRNVPMTSSSPSSSPMGNFSSRFNANSFGFADEQLSTSLYPDMSYTFSVPPGNEGEVMPFAGDFPVYACWNSGVSASPTDCFVENCSSSDLGNKKREFLYHSSFATSQSDNPGNFRDVASNKTSSNQQRLPFPETSNRSSLDDGYKWRKYGQKQLKRNENSHSYYKCAHQNCPTKKKVERSFINGHITEIVHKGAHNHDKPRQLPGSSNPSNQLPAYHNWTVCATGNDFDADDKPDQKRR